ncbi:hypothetical protein NMK71_03055 [Weeksellaceae bacterium KMM 9713]|uniref:Uncharacterized protein n=1 Tax=Profundicola chukchiensis TaxID=2961959 RepID=A0A9X4MUY8_9FLAO|nr:hypothetical protein [Profundicola chukchiensis]MDG4945381.1 hypothetical protein [Profundicola chukchiensis]MDG4950455.1 hypothetical protein [Profundicola chukchiensis]
MKNLLFGAVMLLGTFAFASTIETHGDDMNTQNYEFQFMEDIVVGGWCEIFIYNSNGEVVDYSYTWEISEYACKKRAKDMLDDFVIAPVD